MDYIIWIVLLFVVPVWVFSDASRLQKDGATVSPSPAMWCILTLIFMPLVILYLLSRNSYAAQVLQKQTRAMVRESQGTQSQEKRFPCPECGEQIPVLAKKCRFCNHVLEAQEQPDFGARLEDYQQEETEPMQEQAAPPAPIKKSEAPKMKVWGVDQK